MEQYVEQFEYILEIIIGIVSVISILILVFGVLVAIKDFMIAQCTIKDKRLKLQHIAKAKNTLGRYVLLGLEILIAADILGTIVKPTLEDIFKLAGIVAIRTVISFFLNKEIRAANTEFGKVTDTDSDSQ